MEHKSKNSLHAFEMPHGEHIIQKNTSLTILLWLIIAIGILAWQGNIFSNATQSGFHAIFSSEAKRCTVKFLTEEVLMHPTQTGVTLMMVPKENVDIRVTFGPSVNPAQYTTAQKTITAGMQASFALEPLRSHTPYTYQVFCKPAGANERFAPRKAKQFISPPAEENKDFSFGYVTDFHFYDHWSTAVFDGKTTALEKSISTFQNLLKNDLSFLVLGGDNAYTHCPSCPGGVLDGVTHDPDYALTEAQANLRYQKLLLPEFLGGVAQQIPFVYVLGNHEGETNPSINQCGHSTQNSLASFAARQTYFANPYQIYGGNPEGSYYSFEMGDSLIVVIDVMRYATLLPKTVEGWTLGAEQLTWLENTLKNSDKKWKFVFAEHLDGGEQTTTLSCYHYGRTGLRATDNNLPTGTFKGEQATIQQWMETYNTTGGATFFISGHDHVTILPTEKPDINGIGTNTYYVKGGRGAGGIPKWSTNEQAFKNKMDWNLDGIPDYDNPGLGNNVIGFFKITVHGKESVTFDYIISTPDNPQTNNTISLTKTIYAK